MSGIALYIHIPFCVKKCAYCDFASFQPKQGDTVRYMSALESEIKAANARFGKLDVNTVFIGGGTPSILPSDDIMRLLAMSRRFFNIKSDAEITIEANPGTVELAKLRDWRASGINRLSIGMQSSKERLLRLIGRVHDDAQTISAVTLAREAGFSNINLDLIYALPTQTMREWTDTLTAALALTPTHISMYSLILESGTPLYDMVQKGKLPEPTEDAALLMRAAAGRILARRGYRRYEISNYAKPGFECRHNIVYWKRGDYLGVGLAAHSFMEGFRFANTAEFDEYLAGVREVSREEVTEAGAREEAIMLGTRMHCGIDLSLVRDKKSEIDQLDSLGLVNVSNSRLALTDKGMDVQNAVVMKLI